MRTLFIFAILHFPLPLLAQSLDPAIEAGYGVTGSRLHTGAAKSVQGSLTVFDRNGFRVRAELFLQQGTANSSGPTCDRLEDQYCTGSSDRNQIAGAGAALHIPIGTVGRLNAYAPVGIGLYNRRTRSRESEGPIAFCFDGTNVISCPGNPAFRTISYATSATVAGYNVGLGLAARVSGVDLYAEMRVHDLLESNSNAGAFPFSIGVRF